MLNRLLNEMDGLKQDADIIFILTTNRPEQLESALAGRPGRIDQAIEVPVPDEVGRKSSSSSMARVCRSATPSSPRPRSGPRASVPPSSRN